jgi:urease accessory protein
MRVRLCIEMSENAGGVAYAAGSMIATALLLAAGLGIGFLVGKAGERHWPTLIGATGGVAAVAGVAILTGVL